MLTGSVIDGYTDNNTPDLCDESGPRWDMEVMAAKEGKYSGKRPRNIVARNCMTTYSFISANMA